MSKLENLDYYAGYNFPTNITVPVSIADKDKFLNLSKIRVHFEQDNSSEEENRFKSYLSAKCPKLENPIHVKSHEDSWTEYSTECTDLCTDTQHNDDRYSPDDDDYDDYDHYDDDHYDDDHYDYDHYDYSVHTVMPWSGWDFHQ